MATGFKKRAVSDDRVAAVESVSANIPIVGDPRMTPSEIGPADIRPVQIPPGVGSSQERTAVPSDYQVGNVYDVPVGLIKSNPFNPRAVLSIRVAPILLGSLHKNIVTSVEE